MAQKEKHSAAERKIFGQRIAEARKALDPPLTQEKLAERMNKSEEAIKRWERGIYSPPEKIIPALAETLHIPPDSLRYIETDFELLQRKQFERAWINEYERKLRILEMLGIKVKRTGSGGAFLEFNQNTMHRIYIEDFDSFYSSLANEISIKGNALMDFIKNHGEEQNERAKYLESKMEKHPKRKGGSDNGQH